MLKILKYIFYGIGSIIILLLLLAAYFALTFNPNDYKDDVIKLVKDKKQRTLTIDGDIKLSYWPKIGADLGKVTLSEHNSDKIFASVNSVKVALAVMPLLKKDLVVDTVYVDGASANIIKYKDGSTNFDDLLSKEESEQIKFDIQGVNITNSALNYSDETAGAEYKVTKLNLQSGHIALAEPVDLETDFSLNSNKPTLAANAKIKGNFLIDPKTRHFKVKGLDSHITGDLLSGKGMDIVASGNLDAKPELLEFLLNDLKFVASGSFDGAKQAIDLSAPKLTVLKDEVSGKKVTASISQEKVGETFKANMVLADMKGSPKALQSSGITGDLSAVQGKRTIKGTFSSPFSGNIHDLIFDIPKLAGNLDIKDPSLPNGGIKGTFNLAVRTDLKKELANSKFSLNMADTKLNGDIDVASFKNPNIKFNLNADKLDLNKLLGKSSTSAKNKPAQEKSNGLNVLKTMTLDGKLNVDSILYDKYRISGLNVGIKADGDKLALSGLNVKLDDSQIKGSFSISHFAKPLYTFDLDIDNLDADKYASSDAGSATSKDSSAKKSSDKPLDLSALKALNAEGAIRIGNLKYGKTKASNVNIQLKGDGQKLSLSPLSATLDGSKIKGSLNIAQFARPKFVFDLDIDKLDANRYMAASQPAQSNNKGLTGLKTFLADGNLRIGNLKYEKYQIANMNVSLKADGQRLLLNPIVAKVDDSQINGRFGISQFARPAYSFDLTIDKLDANRYMAASQPAQSNNKGLAGLKTFFADGNLRIGNLKYEKYQIANMNVSLKADGQQLLLNPIVAKVDDSQINGRFGISQFARPAYSFDLDVDKLDVNRYLVAGATSPQKSNKPADLTQLNKLFANGALRVASLKYNNYQLSSVKVGLKADGQNLQLSPLVAKIDDSQFDANLDVSRFNDPIYNFKVKIDKLDADRYITKTSGKSTAETPIDLSALKKLNASGEAKIGWLKLANVKTENVNLGLKAEGGIATLSPFAANLYQGSMDGALKVDARTTPNITFKQSMKGVSVGPLLTDAVNYDSLSGHGTVNVDVSTQGNTVGALKRGLQGSSSLNLADGALKGLDIAGGVRDLKNKVNIFKAKDPISADNKKTTDFSELTATFDIKNGVAHNEDLAMKAPILRLAKGDSRGDFDIANQTINYIAKPSLVKSLKGQGGAELDQLSGIAIPIKVSGTFSDPKYGMDFGAVVAALAKSSVLEKVGGEKGAAVKELLGGGDKVEALKGILGKKKTVTPAPAETIIPPTDPATAPATPAETPTPTPPAGTETTPAPPTGAEAAPTPPAPPAETPKSLEEQAKEKAKEKLKKLLKF